MLTIDPSTLREGDIQVCAAEFDLEHGEVRAFGAAALRCTKTQSGEPALRSFSTGNMYWEREIVWDLVEVWSQEECHLAIFADESALRAGARLLVARWWDRLSVAIRGTLTA